MHTSGYEESQFDRGDDDETNGTTAELVPQRQTLGLRLRPITSAARYAATRWKGWLL